MSENNIFQKGDVVYHAYFGKGTISKCVVDGISVLFATQENIFSKGYALALLSFSEWTAAPNHVRPLKNGVYKVEYGGEHWVMCFSEYTWYFVDSCYTTMIGKEVGFPDEVSNPEFLYSLKYRT